ncbi:MAG: hypothetical protein AB1487_00450 [Thermodesulfobacteriota bacterium]
MQALRKKMKVGSQGIIRLRGLPYPPGTEVEVIVLPEPGQEGIYDYTAQLISRKKIPKYSTKEIEKIVHEARGV